MSENSANKRNHYFNRKKKNRNRNDSDNGSRSSNASNYQRLLSNSSSNIGSKNYTSQLTPIILQRTSAGGDTNVLPWVDRTGTILLAKYGNSAKFFSGEAYKRDRPTLNVYDEVNDPSGVLRKMQETAWVEYTKESTRLKNDRPKIWGDTRDRALAGENDQAGGT